MQWSTISLSWPRVFVWFFFLALFSGFGYAGNLGILVGFLCVLVSILALAISFGGGARERTHLEINVPHLSYHNQNVTLVSAENVQARDEGETHTLTGRHSLV